jgi:nucleoside-diphosphate-sugar epimerase
LGQHFVIEAFGFLWYLWNKRSERAKRSAIDSGVKRLVFVSSIGVNGDVTDDLGFSEESVVAPRKDYAVSKYEAELGLQELAEGSGIELVIVRPPLI